MTNSMTQTVRLNTEWARRTCDDHGGPAGLADKLNVDKSTVYRHLAGDADASSRFIATVLSTFPVRFDEAFDVTETKAHKRRTYRRAET